jgi:(4-O-methyl)-D-glucuronate---lignin esterase
LIKRSALIVFFGLITFIFAEPVRVHAQQAAAFNKGKRAAAGVRHLPKPVTFSTEQDHKNMMDQLGIKALRPGPSGDEKAPNHANYDESKANPFPDLPDPLRHNNDGRVTTPEEWWKKRRPEIVQDFEREIYGRVPPNVPKVTWSVVTSETERLGFMPVVAKELIGHVDNSAYPLIDVNIRMTLVTPANAKEPVPVLMMFGPSGFPAPNQPSEEELDRINTALKALLAKQDPSLQKVFKDHPAYQLERPVPFEFPHLNADGGLPSTWEIIGDGWGYATIDPSSIQADDGAGLTRGIIGLVNKGQPRKPDQWGSLRSWAWGAGRGLDYLETNPAVDAKHVGIEGVSRYGKAALVTMAFDQRFALVLIGSSGKGGATLLRRNFGEAVENLTGAGEYHWMAGNFLKYGASEASFGSKNASDLPVDSHELIALCAPRLTFISYGLPSKGDAKWLDHQGSFMAAVAAGPVFTLLGAKGLDVSGNYHTAQMPPVNVGLLDGQLAWRQDDGGHTDAPNVIFFLKWADHFIGHTPPPH